MTPPVNSGDQVRLMLCRRINLSKLCSSQGFGNRSIEPLLRGDRAFALQMAGAERPLSHLLSEIETAKGRKRLAATLNKRPYPHYKPVPDHPDLICRIEQDGSQTVGRFVGREFKANGFNR